MIIFNPTAGNESGKKYAEKLKEKIELDFDEVVMKETEKEKDATDFAIDACKESYDSVFSIGGDGTVNEVVNGLIKSGSETKPILGVIPGGTYNGFARVLKIPQNAYTAINKIDLSRFEEMDIATSNGDVTTLNFNIGDIPESIQNVTIEEKSKFAVLSYVINAIQQSSKNTHHNLKITLDEDQVVEGEFSHLIITLSSTLDEFNFVEEEVKRADGHLHMLLFKKSNFASKLSLIADMIKGDVDKNEEIEYYRAKKIIIESLEEEEVKTGIDGDMSHNLPVQIELIPKALAVYSLYDI